ICAPAKIDLTASAVTAGSTAGLTYTYFTNALATIHVADSTKIAIGSTYYIVGTLLSTGCSDTTAVVVTINPQPTLVTHNPAPVCAPAKVDITIPADTVGSTTG